jgi:hypothetical protein
MYPLVLLFPAEPSKEATQEQETESTTEPAKSTSATTKKANDTDEYQVLKVTFDNNWQQLQAIIKGTNNLEPIIIHCDKDVDGITDEALKAIEGTWI